MTRRLTLAILGTVAAALVLTGGVTLALTRLSARADAEEEALRRAEAVAAVLQLAGEAVQGRIPIREQLAIVTERLRVQGVGLVAYGPDGRPLEAVPTELPEGVAADDLDASALGDGRSVSGQVDGRVYAAAPVQVTQGGADAGAPPAAQATVAVVVTGTPDELLDRPIRWFLLAAGLALVAAAIVAYSLGRRLSLPLREATDATRRIADGDLEVRVPVRTHGRPDELTELGAAVNQTAESLARAQDLERHFLMSVSHDLRTPLTSITGYAEAIVDGAVPDDRHAAGIILAEARRLERLVRDLLDLARLDARRFRLSTAPVDVTAVARRVADGFVPRASEAGIDLAVHGPDGVRALADADRLAQVTANLVENALRFAERRVAVTVEAGDETVTLAVTDDGPGIGDDDLPRVFDRLYVARQSPVRSVGGPATGSGLGLAIVRELVEAMGGAVAAGGVHPHGTRIDVRLPRASSQREDLDAGLASADGGRDGPRRRVDPAGDRRQGDDTEPR